MSALTRRAHWAGQAGCINAGFHPNVSVPMLLKYVEDGDLYLFKLPDSRAIISYMYAQPFHFNEWDSLSEKLENEVERAVLIE